jgi:tape measure domain-containing protein
MATSANNQKDVSLNINVNTLGDEKLQALADDFKAVGAAGEAGEAQLAGLAAELAAATDKTKTLRAAESAAVAQAAATKASIADQRDALARLRLTTDAAARSTDGYKAQVRAARLALLDNQAALRQQQAALDKAGTSARIAAAEEAKLAAEIDRTTAATTKAAVSTTAATESVSALSTAGGEAAAMMGHLAPLVAAAFGAHQFIEAITAQQSLVKGFEAVFGSSQRAADEMRFVHDTANRLGLGAQELQHEFLNLAASTRGTVLEGQATRDVFVAVTQAMGSLGKSSADTQRALAAVAQMASTGRVNMTELRRELAVDMPGAMQALANGAGITVQQLTAMSESGELLAQDVLPALAKGLTDMYGKAKPPEGILNEWARLKNTITDTEVAIGEGGASKGIAKGLAWLTLGVRGTSDAFDVAGNAIGAFAAGLREGKITIGDAAEMNAKYDAELRKAAEAAGLIDKAVQGATTATQAQVRALDNATMATEHHGESMLAVHARYNLITTAAAQLTTAMEASAKARQAEGQALVQLTNVYGTETERRQAAAHAAEMQSTALRGLARAKDDEAIIAQSYALKLRDEAKARGDTTDATLKEIKTAEQSATVKRAEADAAKANATAKNIEAHAAKANAEATKDLSTRVYELRGAAQSAAAEVERLVDAQKHGKASAEQVADAEAKAAAATALYREAMRDATAAAERKVQAEQRAASLAQGAIDVERERAMAIRDVAHASGDEATAARANEQAQQLQVQAARAAADAASHEAAAMRDSADAKETEARATGTLTAKKQAEIDATRDAAAAKDLEAQKADILASKLDGLTAAEQRRTSAAKDAARGDGRAGNLVPLDKAAAVMQNHGDGMSVDDLKAAAKQANDGKAWLDNMVKAGGGADIDPSAYASIMGMQAATRTALENAQRREAQDTRQKAAAAAPAPAAATPHQIIRHEIPTPGRTHTVDVVGHSSDAMTDLIKTLTAAKAAAGAS